MAKNSIDRLGGGGLTKFQLRLTKRDTHRGALRRSAGEYTM
jgi:hypothetical protein